jgi:hypothetical protein
MLIESQESFGTLTRLENTAVAKMPTRKPCVERRGVFICWESLEKFSDVCQISFEIVI